MSEGFDLKSKIELWKLKSWGHIASQSPKFKKLDSILEEFIRRIKKRLPPRCTDIKGKFYNVIKIIDEESGGLGKWELMGI